MRPVNLDLRSMHYPPMAIVSILHRLSGILLFLLTPVMLYLFSLSLGSIDSYYKLILGWQNCWLMRSLIWLFGAGLLFHGIAGVRHLLMDVGLGESLRSGRVSAWVVLVLALLSIILLGVVLW